jgi:formamidopyrimidine-DNA glycosylase
LPELPDVVVYLEALTRHIVGRRLERITLHSPFVLRTVDPPIDTIHGRIVRGVRRIGKRIVLEFDEDLFLVIHLMIAGRLRWREPGKKSGMGPKLMLASFLFEHGTLFFTEASSKKRASLQLVRGAAALHALDPGGVEPLEATREQFHEALTRESHTLKRTLTDPHLFSGIGNAYSDEILHTARMSPFAIASRLSTAQISTLHAAMRTVLLDAVQRSVGQKAATLKSEKRSGLAVHARTGLPCPVCGDTVREVSFADKSLQYCPTCQTGGKNLADRRLSRLVK